jgi:hypothetical protein
MLVVLKYLLGGTSDDLEIWNTYYQHRVDLMEKLAIPKKSNFTEGMIRFSIQELRPCCLINLVFPMII